MIRLQVVRWIAAREFRDLLRDRRTLFLILGLPVLLYPIFGLVGLAFALTMLEQKIQVGIVGTENLPPYVEYPEALITGGPLAVEFKRRFADPPLIHEDKFLPIFTQTELEMGKIEIVPIPSSDDSALQSRKVDVLVIIPNDLRTKANQDQRAEVKILGREGDETSKMAVKRVGNILRRWQDKWKQVRFARKGLAADFDEPIRVIDPQDAKPLTVKTADELRDMLVKMLPFLLVVWTLAGALHPAIDMTAGEKERGTMETLLISPAERSEIVAGKFATVTLFAYITALWNLLWMAGGAMVISQFMPFPVLSFTGLAWSILFALPMAALFGSLGLGLGIFARSAKEGQYYLMPLFILVMPLLLWSLTPGLKLSLGLTFVPITGLSLTMQRLLAISSEPVPLLYWFTGLGSLCVWVVLSLIWASYQFRRENVLFREGDRWDLIRWLRSLRKKPPQGPPETVLPA